MIDRLLALQTRGVKLGLDGISRLCKALGHPEHAVTALHVAGTNGKGSVTAMAHEALVAAGIRAGRFTSPHLTHLSERFVIGRDPVAVNDLEAATATVLDLADDLVADGWLPALPTFFEATTAIAFELFRRAGVKVAVIEVGLGGRFDATNVVGAHVGAITSVGLDHQEYLGDTLAAIAFEKAGIITPGMTVVTGDLPAEAAGVIDQVAHARDAHVVPATAGARVTAEALDGQSRVEIETPDGHYGPVPLALRGDHQVRNALVAVRLLEAAREASLAIPPHAIAQGLAGARWPARLELIALAGGRRVLIDAAHNVDGATVLAAYLGRWHPERPALVVGAMDDKDLDGMLHRLLPVTGPIVATAVPIPRAVAAADVARAVGRLDPSRAVEMATDPADALRRALATRRLACVAGSIFVAGALREAARPHAILLGVPASS